MERGNAGQPAPAVWSRGAYQPILWLPDEEFPRWPATDPEYNSIDGFAIKRKIDEITAISRRSRDDGNQYWGRITATPYDRMAADWTANAFRKAGLDVNVVEHKDLPTQWFPTSWEVVASAAERSVPITTAYPLYRSVPTEGEIALAPVWVGTGLDADFQGRDLRGKAAVAYGFPNPGGRSNTAITNGVVARAEAAGAAALFIILGFPGNVSNVPQAGGTEPPASMPIFMVGNDDGTAIREMIEGGQAAEVRIRLDVDLREGCETASVWGTLPGATDENIAVMAHTDCFFEGAMDNASGMATMVALAEYYAAKPPSERRRTMTFFTSTAHHSPSGEDAGVRWVHNTMQDMFQKTALILNCEHTAQVATFFVGNTLYASNQVSARRWYVGGGDSLKGIVKKTLHDYGMALYSRPEGRPGGELGRLHTDAPSFHIIDHTVYHTDMDTLQAVPAYGLEQSARCFAKIIDEVNKVDLASLRENLPTG